MTDELHAKRPPFVQIPLSWATALRSVDIHVALVLGGYAGHHGGRAWPSIATLARDTGLSENTVRAALTRLQESKVLTVEHRKHPNGRDRSNAYVIDLTGAGLGEGAKSEPMGAKSEPSPEGMGANSEPIEGANFEPTEGAKFEDDLDQEKIQIHVDTDPLPPTPSPADPGVGVGDSPSAPSEPEQPGVPVVTDSRSAPTDPAVLVEMGDRLTLNRMTLEWETRPGEPFDWFVDYQMRVLPQKPDKATMRRNALSYIRKARTLPERYAQVRDEFGLAKAEQEEKQRQAELAESLDDYFRRQRYGYG